MTNIIALLILVALIIWGIRGVIDYAQYTQKNLMPMTGHEPAFRPRMWNRQKDVRRYNNCYAYALDDLEARDQKPQPGRWFGDEIDGIGECDAFWKFVLKDNPHIQVGVDSDSPCPEGHYKIYAALDLNAQDYHFLRQDSNGYWSHKPGANTVRDYDARGWRIKDPDSALLDYGDLNYSRKCGFACVPANAVANTNAE